MIIMPTEQCNFRCKYCYEDFEIGNMKSDTISAVKALISRRVASGLRKLQINWFGGEPLLARSIVEDISRHALDVTENTDCSYLAGMTTNGYLLTEEQLKKNYNVGIKSYQITLDGPSSIHNLTRIRRNGSGSFERIWENLIKARDSQITANFLLRLHVTAQNIESIIEFADVLRAEFGSDGRFKFFPKIVNNYGGAHFDIGSIPGRENAAEALSKVQQALGLHVPVGHGPAAGGSCNSCYAAQPTSLVIRANGRINKCTVTLNDPKNDVGFLNDDGTVEISDQKMNYWLRGLASGRPEQLSCPAFTK
ncbi:radical SAM protein [Neokomagataea sp. TBRC 2177]|uniref:Radical SAM protein n=2 Tax=Neokomagataea anthophila TaxID=2826925 RepID=A0ABS5E9B1_9PROT|nr:radical SAM protein [Neokomagataea anthophila]